MFKLYHQGIRFMRHNIRFFNYVKLFCNRGSLWFVSRWQWWMYKKESFLQRALMTNISPWRKSREVKVSYPHRKNIVSPKTVSYWLKNKSKIFEGVEENYVSKKLKVIKKQLPMKKWILLKNGRHNNIPINSNIFEIKALNLEKPLGFDDFQTSEGWLGRWKKRSSVTFKIVSSK